MLAAAVSCRRMADETRVALESGDDLSAKTVGNDLWIHQGLLGANISDTRLQAADDADALHRSIIATNAYASARSAAGSLAP
jgi:hypothetical protein